MRFSDFLLVSDPGDLEFIVGYTEDENIRINVSDFFGNQIFGSGNPGYIPVFTGTQTLGNSQIFQDGANIVIGGVNAMGYRLAVGGSLYTANGAVINSTVLGADALKVIGGDGDIFVIPNDLGQSISSLRRIIHPPAILTTESATLGQVNTAILNLENDIDILLDLKVDKTSIGVPNGVASLDSGGKVPLSQIPDSIIGQVQYMGTWNAFTNTPTLNPLVPEERGHYYVVSAAGVFGGVDYQIGDWIISNGVIWEKVDNTDAVTSVFGRIGAILALEGDYQAFYPRLSQYYDNPTWINTLAFTKITGVPAFLLENQTITLSGDVTGSGKTSIASTISNNAVSNEKLRDSVGTSVIGRSASTTGDPADIQATTDGHVLLRSAGNLLFGLISGDSISSIDWSKITGTPTTLSGYGITDAYTKTESDNKFVPYTGASANVNLGSNNITANSFIKAGGTSSQFLKADGSVDTSQYVPTTRSVNAGTGLTGGGNLSSDITIAFDTTWGDNRYAYRTRQLTINGTTYDLSADRTWTVGTVNTLTTIGTSGPATLVGNILNIPNYSTDLTGYVPYTGATQNVNLGEFGLSGGYFQADLSPTQAAGVGRLIWNNTDGTLNLRLLGGNVDLHIGQQQYARVVNGTGGNVLRANYQVVKIIGAQGQRMQVGLARSDNDFNSKDTLGLIAENINNNNEGFVVSSGLIEEINTTGSLQGETWTDGDTLYLSGTTFGRLTNIKPIAPIHTVIVGFVVYAHANHGKIFVKVDNGYELEELHDVNPLPYVNNGVLYRDTTTNLWKSATIPTVLGYTPANSATTITINGVTYDLSANRSWSVGTVNTLTTTGTSGPATLVGSTLNIPNYTTDLSGYVTLATNQTITGLKTILRSGDVLNFKIGTDTLYGLKVAYNQNELAPSGEATWSFVNTFNNGSGTGLDTTPISFFRGVLVTGQRLVSASVNTNLLDYYGNNPSGRYPIYAYNTGVQQFASSIIVGETTGVVNAITGAISDLPAGVVANFKGRVIGSNAVNSNEFATLGQVTSTSRAAISLTTTGTSGPATYNNTTGVLNIPEYQGGVTSFNTRTGAVTLTSSDVTTALGYTPVTDARTLTINGVTYDLTANRSWTVSVNPSAREIQTYIATASQTTFTVTGGYTVGLVDVFINGVRLTSSDYTATNGTTVVLTVGTMVGNIVDIIKYTSGFTNAVSGTGTANELAYFTGTTTIGSLSTATYPSLTELSYVKGVTSSIQTQLNAKQAAGTYVTSVTASSPLASSGGTTPNITIQQASGSQSGFLSSTDWTTFNGKQNALTNPVTGTGTTNYLPKFTASTTIGNSLIFDNGTQVGINTNTIASDFGLALFGLKSLMVFQNSNTGQTNSDGFIVGSFGGTEAYLFNYENAALIFGTNGQGRMRIFDDGNVFIGSSPSNAGFKLDVNGTGRFNGTMSLENDGTYGSTYKTLGFTGNSNGSHRIFAGTADDMYFAAATARGFQFWTNGANTTQMMITSGGNLLVGTTSDNGARLQVSGFGTYTVTGDNTRAIKVIGTTNRTGYLGHAFGTLFIQNNNYFNGSSYVFDDISIGCANVTLGQDIAFQTGAANTNPSTKVTIANSGNVGIGTASPSAAAGLALAMNSGANQCRIALKTSSTGDASGDGFQIGVAGISAFIEQRENADLTFATNASERMRITSGGNVLIGTTTDNGNRLQVNGNSRLNGALEIRQANNTFNDGLFLVNTPLNTWNLVNGGDNNLYFAFNYGAASVITPAGNYIVLSDRNKKKDFEDSTIGLNAILGLKPTLYRMLDEDESAKKQLGFIAQEVKDYIPQAYVEQDNFIGLQDRPIVAALVKAVQELKAELDELKGNN